MTQTQTSFIGDLFHLINEMSEEEKMNFTRAMLSIFQPIPHISGVKIDINEDPYFEHIVLIKEKCLLEKLNKAIKNRLIETKNNNGFKIKVENIQEFYKTLKKCKVEPLIFTAEDEWDFVIIEEDEIFKIDKFIDKGFVLLKLENVDENDFAFFSFKKKEAVKELINKVDLIEIEG